MDRWLVYRKFIFLGRGDRGVVLSSYRDQSVCD